MKETMLEAARRHRDADILMAGTYGDEEHGEWKGCSIGCLARDHGMNGSDSHAALAEIYGVPEWMLHLQDRIFEGLSSSDGHRDWHVQVAEAYEKVDDWSLALHRVHMAILTVATQTDSVKAVYALHHRAASGDNPQEKEWSAAESAARSAAWSAARSAARSAAWSAAESAARSAAFISLRDAILSALEPADQN